MIPFCRCTGGLSTNLEGTRSREVALLCKICGGKPLVVDGRGVLSGSMLSTVGLKLTRVIDPDLNWKTVSKRRARSSVAGGYKKKPAPGIVKQRTDLIDKNLKKVEDMPVSESEKLGVTILGRRFSEPIESVPIKKRKFRLVRSPSPPPRTPLPCSKEFEGLLKNQSASDQHIAENLSFNEQGSALHCGGEQQDATMSTGTTTNFCPLDNLRMIDKTINLEDINGKHGVSVDFSGISILAAAACNTNVGGSSRNAEDSLGKGYSPTDEGHLSIQQHGRPSSEPSKSCKEHELNGFGSSGGRTDVKTGAEVSAGENCISVGTSKDFQKDLGIGFSNEIDDKKTVDYVMADKSMHSSPDLSNEENETIGRAGSVSSRDDRLHWDLNTVMDAWESPCNDPIIYDKRLADGTCEWDTEDVNGGLELCQVQTKLQESKCISELMLQRTDSQVALDDACSKSIATVNSRIQEGDNSSSGGSDADFAANNEAKVCISVPGIHQSTEEEHLLDAFPGPDRIGCLQERHLSGLTDSDPNASVNVAGEAIAGCNERKSSFTTEIVAKPVEHAPESVDSCNMISICAVSKEKAVVYSMSSDCIAEGETRSSLLVVSEDVCVVQTTNTNELQPDTDGITINRNLQEDHNPTSRVDLKNQSVDQFMTDAKREETVCPRTPLLENNKVLQDADLYKVPCNTVGDLTVPYSAKGTTGFLGDEEGKKIAGGGFPCHVVQVEPESLDVASSSAVHHSETFNTSSCHVDTDTSVFQSSPKCEALSTTETARLIEGEKPVPDMNTQDGKVSEIADEEMHATGTEFPVHVESKDPMTVGNPTSETAVVLDPCSPKDGMRSPEECRSDVNSACEIALEDTYESDYDSDNSQDDPDHSVVEMGEVGEILADDDSQYEDGEFREPIGQSWVEDLDEEGEAEPVDYGSDNREADILLVESAQCNKEMASEANHVHHDIHLFGKKNEQEGECQPSLQGLLESDNSDVGNGKKETREVVRKISRGQHGRRDGNEKPGANVEIAVETSGASDKLIVDDELGLKEDGARESHHPVSLRMKSSGWDRLPEISRSSEAVMSKGSRTSVRNYTGSNNDMSDGGDSLRRLLGKELSSWIEGPMSSDASIRKDKVYIHGSRPDNPDDPNLRSERNVIGRVGSGRGGDHWLESSGGTWSQNRRHSPGYFGSSDFGISGPKNAAAVAAAKVESSGFVVAPDGTIVKAGGAGPGGRVLRGSENASSERMQRSLTGRGSPTDRDGALGMQIGLGSVREMSPDRNINVGRGQSGKYALRMVGVGPPERYNGPVHDEFDASMRMQHPLARRERSFSPFPRTTSLHPSRARTKSRSRSRTRSPIWTSPRGRGGGEINGALAFQRHSRSPNFRSEARMERVRSPNRRPYFPEYMVRFVSASRSHGFPRHASRWVHDRKDGPDRFREHEFKRSSVSERSPPGRVFSRSHRIDLMDSPGRLKADEFYRPLHTDRFPEFGVGRGPRHAGSDDDRRKHGDRYRMIHPLRHHDIDGDVKRFKYDEEDGFRAHISRAKSASDIRGRGSPRECGRGIESRLGNAPRRAREEKDHFRYHRERKHNAGFKNFGMRDCEEDVAPRRRRPS